MIIIECLQILSTEYYSLWLFYWDLIIKWQERLLKDKLEWYSNWGVKLIGIQFFYGCNVLQVVLLLTYPIMIQIWAEQLTRMYIKWAEKQCHKARIVEKQDSESVGIKYAMIELEFKSAYGYLSGERGIHYMSGSSENKFDLSKVF